MCRTILIIRQQYVQNSRGIILTLTELKRSRTLYTKSSPRGISLSSSGRQLFTPPPRNPDPRCLTILLITNIFCSGDRRSRHTPDTVATVAAPQAVTAHPAPDGTATEEDTTPTDHTPTTLDRPWPTVDKSQLPDRDYGKSE